MQAPPETPGPAAPSRLPPAAQARLQERLKRRSGGVSRQAIPRRSEAGPVPLSFAQERIWFLTQLNPESAAYNIARAFVLRGPLDHTALELSVREVARRHQSLRTTFAAGGSGPLQRIDPDPVVGLPVADLSGLPAGSREPEAGRLRHVEAERFFDLARGPLLRLALLCLGAEEHTLLLTLHHAVADGWSMAVLCRQLSRHYSAFRQGLPFPFPELPVQYADFAVWQRARLQGDLLARLLAYWRQQLASAPPVLELPADRPRPAVRTFAGARRAFDLPVPASALQEAGGARGASPFMVLLAAFFALLHRTTGREDLVVGSPLAGRDRSELEGAIGLFINTVVLRGDLTADPTFEQVLRRVRETALGAWDHQELPFEKLVEALAPERDLSHTPLFQVLFALQNTGRAELELTALAVEPLEVWSGTAKFDLSFNLLETGEGFGAVLIYDREIFDAATMARLAGHYAALLAGAAADPGRRLSDLPFLTSGESQQLCWEWNDTGTSYPELSCLHALIAVQAERSPQRIAVAYEGDSLTYGELEAAAGRLAQRLAGLGAGPDVPVGICAERSLELVVGLLAILKSGSAYLPLDPAYPADRLAYMLEDSRVPVLLAQKRLLERLPDPKAAVLFLDGVAAAGTGAPPHPGHSGVLPGSSNLAYVIYTSGSTGRPKGTMNTHRGIVNRLLWMQERFGLTMDDAVLQKTPFSFDVSVWEFFWPLLVGARLVMARPGGHQDPSYLVETIAVQEITTLHFVPSMLQAFLEAPGAERCTSLTRVLCSGEALPVELERRFYARMRTGASLFNLYGPTEAAVDVTHWACEPESRRTAMPIGVPVANTRIHLLDRSLSPVPTGTPGELFIGGVQVGRGYLGRPGLTAEKFVPDPFEPGARLYRTGDLARRLPSGEIEFLGRIDHQVKIRGFRIELQEIEAALAALPAVREAVVVALDGGSLLDRRLVAYVVVSGGGGGDLSAAALRESLQASLPDYMVPAVFVVLPALPLSPNGKVDRRALPAPEAPRDAERPFTPPRTSLERFLADLWRNHLGTAAPAAVGAQDDFFALGGNSISGALLINRLQEKLGEIVHVVALFDAPTVERMAGYLGEHYPEAVSRIWGEGGAARIREGRIGPSQVAAFRAAVQPLARCAAEEPKNPRAVFLLSPPRSGSTLLRVMLAGHPGLFAPPELELLSFNSLRERRDAYAGRGSFWLEGTVRAVMELRGCGPEEAGRIVAGWEEEGWSVQRAYLQFQEWLGPRLLVDKTPTYALDPAVLRRAEETFAEPRYLHLVRHPGGAIASFEEARLDQVFFRHPHRFSRRELAELSWLVCHENTLRFLSEIPGERWHRVRFEELVADPEGVLSGICRFLGLPYHADMAQPYQGGSRRMVDGLHAESRMMGDVKFHRHAGIDTGVAERWRERLDEASLGDETVRLAAALGYASAKTTLIRAADLPPGVSLPLSFAQERLWFLSLLEPDSPFYNIPAGLRLFGRLDVLALARSLAEVRNRHSILRAVFAISPEGPALRVAPPSDAALPAVDLSSLAGAEAEARRLGAQEARRPFDLETGPPMRATLLRLSASEHLLLLTLHHTVADGWSMGIFARELAALYGAFAGAEPSPLRPPPIQYADFARWQRERLAGEGLEEHLAYWRRQLAGAPSLLELPTDRPRPPVMRFRGSQVPAGLGPRLTAALAALGRERRATLFMTLAAGFAAVLSRSSGLFDVPLGTVVAGRNRPECENLIGLFVNTLVLRADLAGDPGFGEVLDRVRRMAFEAFVHQDVPFEKLVQELQPERSLAHSPLFQVMMMLARPWQQIELPGLTLAFEQPASGTVKFDLNLALTERENGISGVLAYNSDLFDSTTAVRMAGHLETLLQGAVEDPARRLSELPLLAMPERHQALREWNDTSAAVPGGSCLHDLFLAQVARDPDAPALLWREGILTYGQLARQSEQLARRLRSLGVQPGVLVAVHLERGPAMAVALLGILQAGGAYVPLSPRYPEERIRYVLSAMEIGHLVTEDPRPGGSAALPVRHTLQLPLQGPEEEPEAPPPVRPGPGDLAYIIFTSGSTGTPKGVMVRHRPAVHLVDWVNRSFGFGPGDRVLFITSLAFDLSVFDVFGLLAAGGSIRVASAEEAQDPERLARLLQEEPITFWDSAPASLQQLVPYLPATPCASARLRLVFLSGDWIPVGLPDRVRLAFPRAQVVSLGGATEATVWSNVHRIDRVDPAWTSIPYGRPMANARYHVLDRDLNVCPIGVPGDLYIAGECLSTGYARDPEVTAGKYVPSPFGEEPGARLYRTGDRARHWGDGTLEFLGRSDNQVKIRGFRIELGEIEAALAAHPDVREAVVLVRENGRGDQRLVAFVIPGEAPAPTLTDLRRFLRARLPDYMLPSELVLRDAWPIASTGKLDRRALLESARRSRTAERPEPTARETPRAALERAVAEIWRRVIGLEEVDVQASFFDLGGHSMLMAEIQVQLREALGREVAMVDLFRYPTVASLAELLAGAAPAPEPAAAFAREPASGSAIAIVGMTGRFPGAAGLEELWGNLCGGVESITFFSREELAAAGVGSGLLDDPAYVRARAVLAGADLFDAAFFDCSPREAEILDPQQRIFLECAWEALEEAGYAPGTCRGRVGVYAGLSENTYALGLYSDPELVRTVGRHQLSLANKTDYLPTRVSYKLGLKGLSVNVQTACSTALVAVHLACRGLLAGDCETALAGGVSVRLPQVSGYRYEEGSISSPDGHVRAFDAAAGGTVGGAGAGVVVLKRLEHALADGDTIRAVILGTAANNDGSSKVGFTAPSVEGQAEVVRQAHLAAGVDPETLGYVEAHGTATPVGDPIEVAGLTQAFRAGTPKRGFCALGSIKTNIGHLDAAAGIAGLLKAALCLERRAIPPSLHFTAPNPRIDFDGSPFYVNAALAPWETNGAPRRAGVSSFGIGGTNAHAILEEAPVLEPGSPSPRPAQLLLLSARTPEALDAATERLADHLERHPETDLADAAYTLQVGRRTFRHRRMLVCGSREEAVRHLRDLAEIATGEHASGPVPVAFLFPGQGAQREGMAAGLYDAEPAFRQALDHAAEILGLDLREGPFTDTRLAQPALFAVEHALAQVLMDWGIRPQAMLGHSLGEYTAACLAGVFSLADGLRLVAARGRLMAELPPGGMVAVALSEDEVQELLPGLSLAAVNGPEACTLSGPPETVAALCGRLERQGIEHRLLHTSHAFHSPAMDPIAERFAEEVRRIHLQPAEIPFLSNVTGAWITAAEATDPQYWVRQMLRPVRFAEGAAALLAEDRILLEVGPGRTLSVLAGQQPGARGRVAATGAEPAGLMKALGKLWLSGVEVDWSGFYARERRRRVLLPTYPFERRSYWLDARGRAAAPIASIPEPVRPPAAAPPPSDLHDPIQRGVAAVFEELLGIAGAGPSDDFFDLGGSSLMAVRLAGRLRETLGTDLPASAVLEASTVAALAERIAALSGGSRPEEGRRPSCLVRLQDRGSRRPLFLVHQVGGHVYSYRALARELAPHQPLYALRSRGLEEGEEPLARVEEMADLYLDLVREAQPRGPYLLGGASMGGLVALEMAHRLRALGEEVPLLILMDTPCREVLPGPPPDEALLAQVLPREIALAPGELRGLDPEGQLTCAVDRMQAEGTLPPGFDFAETRRLLAVLRNNIAALFAYDLRAYDGRALFFRAVERRPQDPARPELPWIDLATGGIEIHVVPGNHATMHEAPHVRILAERLRCCLGRPASAELATH